MTIHDDAGTGQLDKAGRVDAGPLRGSGGTGATGATGGTGAAADCRIHGIDLDGNCSTCAELMAGAAPDLDDLGI